MLKLKYLFDNRDLALMLLSNWAYDHNNTDIMDYYRISANAVYPFYQDGKVCFLRFTPMEEKQPQMIRAELDFIRYLREKSYPAPETVLSKKHREIEACETPWGNYIAVVFKGIGEYSQRLDRHEYSDSLYHGYGEKLGQLHLLSKMYSPAVKRQDWRDKLHSVSEILKECAAPETALKEAFILETFFSSLPMTPDNYGLVHYDFEPDNIFYDETTLQYGVIDFDDAIYHWFVLDIGQSIDSIKDELPGHLCEQAVAQFLKGYDSVKSEGESMLTLMPIFRRYVNLVGYARCLRSIYEKWNNEPDWMIELRKQLENSMGVRSKYFGEEIKPA